VVLDTKEEKMKNEKISEFAEQLFDNGFTVLPVGKGEKKPVVVWKAYQDVRPTEEEVQEWFADDVNLGILCGTASSNLLALDFDKSSDYEKWAIEYREIIPNGYVEQTPRGYHVLFRITEPVQKEALKNYQEKFHVETGWRGHCIVVAPSLHESGKHYEPISGQLQNIKPIQPEKLGLKLIESKTSEKKESIEKIIEGKRNIELFAQAVKMAKGGFSQEAIVAALDTENFQKCLPPLDQTEILNIAKSAYNYRLPETEQRNTNFKITPIQEIFTAPEIAWAIDGVLYDNSLTMLGAFAGKGKTMLAMEIERAIASGEPFLGRFAVNRTGNVLVIDEENSLADLHSRMLDMQIDPKLPIYYLSFQGITIDDNNCFAALQAVVSELKPALVVIDSLIRVHGGKENEADSMAPVMKRLRAIVNMGTNVLILHHHRKGKGDIEERARGSSDIVGSIDVELALVQKGNHLELSSGKTRREPIEPLKMRIEVRNGKLGYYLIEEPENKKKKAIQIIKNMLQEPMTFAEIQTVLNEAQINYSDKTVRGLLGGMKDEIVENHTTKNKSVYQLREARIEGMRLKHMQKMKDENSILEKTSLEVQKGSLPN